MKYVHPMTRLAAFLLAIAICRPAIAADATVPAEPAAEVKLPKGVRVVKDLAYVENGSANQRLDLYLPEKAEGPLPVIVFLHGGAWHKGDKNRPSLVLRQVPRGYAVASVEYRFSQEAVFPAQIYDAKAAVRWLRAHAGEYGLEPDRVGVIGASAGGHLAALLGTSGDVTELEGEEGNLDQSSRVQCVVDCYGPADFTMKMPINTSVVNLLGGTPSEKKELARLASPTAFVSKDDPPFLILHGDADPVVPIEQSRVLAKALEDAGAKVTFRTVEGGEHGGEKFKAPELRDETDAFFDQHLNAGSDTTSSDSRRSDTSKN